MTKELVTSCPAEAQPMSSTRDEKTVPRFDSCSLSGSARMQSTIVVKMAAVLSVKLIAPGRIVRLPLDLNRLDDAVAADSSSALVELDVKDAEPSRLALGFEIPLALAIFLGDRAALLRLAGVLSVRGFSLEEGVSVRLDLLSLRDKDAIGSSWWLSRKMLDVSVAELRKDVLSSVSCVVALD